MSLLAVIVRDADGAAINQGCILERVGNHEWIPTT